MDPSGKMIAAVMPGIARFVRCCLRTWLSGLSSWLASEPETVTGGVAVGPGDVPGVGVAPVGRLGGGRVPSEGRLVSGGVGAGVASAVGAGVLVHAATTVTRAMQIERRKVVKTERLQRAAQRRRSRSAGLTRRVIKVH
jgi:hypothetical protein